MHAGAYGVAGHDYLVCREEAFHAFIGHADFLHTGAEHLVGQAGKAVLLLDEGGNPHCCGGPEQGSAGISAHAHCDFRFELPDELTGLAYAAEVPGRHQQVVRHVAESELTLQSDYRQTYDTEALCRDFFHFHLALGSHEENLGFRIHLHELLGDGDRREDMSPGAASTDDYPEFPISHIRSILR